MASAALAQQAFFGATTGFDWQHDFGATVRREQQQFPHSHDGQIMATASSRLKL